MDESFFQTLRQIQKKERTNASLARVGPDFYKRVHSYINQLKRSVGNDPFSDEHYLLKDSQRIATEICERREHKITDAAVMNIHRSYHLFSKSNPEFDLLDTTPLNLTEEEETLYFSLIDTLKEHRLKISLDKFSDKEDSLASNRPTITNPYDDEDNNSNSNEYGEFNEEAMENLEEVNNESSLENINKKEEVDVRKKSTKGHSDAILDKLNQIKKAKVVDDEKYEDINKQIANQNSQIKSSNLTTDFSKSKSDVISSRDVLSSNSTKSDVDSSRDALSSNSNKFNNKSDSEIDINDLYNQDNQFVNLDELDNSYDQYFDDVTYEPNPFEFDDLIKENKLKSKSKSNNSIIESQSNSLENNSKESESQLNHDVNFPGSDVDSNSKVEIKGKDYDNIAILIFNDVGPIVGVDEKIYGPFHSQDVVILPKINAEIFINADSARLVDI